MKEHHLIYIYIYILKISVQSKQSLISHPPANKPIQGLTRDQDQS